MKTAIVTGGGSGLGKALALGLVKQGIQVYIVGRTQSKLESVAELAPDNIQTIVADVSTADGRQHVHDQFKESQLDYLIHDAAVLGPLKKIAYVNEQEWRHTFAINVEGPLFLTQKLLPFLKPKSRVLHISSGAAHSCLSGLATYACSKATLYMLYQAWSVDSADTGILFGSIRPGVVDTDMQVDLRAENKDFPSQSTFKAFHDNKQLISPHDSAKKIHEMLLNMSDTEYTSKEWDVREAYFDNI